VIDEKSARMSGDNDNDLIPTRQSLLTRLKNRDDQDGWRRFFETYWKLIYGAAVKAGLTDAEAQDVVQETVVSVMKRMPKFKYDAEIGSFKGWLLQSTRWRIADQLRKRMRVKEDRLDDPETGTKAIDRIADPAGFALEADWDEEWERNLLEAAVDEVKRTVDPRHFQIFDLCVSQKWPAARVAEVLRVSRGKIYLIKHRIGLLIRKEIIRLRTKPI